MIEIGDHRPIEMIHRWRHRRACDRHLIGCGKSADRDDLPIDQQLMANHCRQFRHIRNGERGRGRRDVRRQRDVGQEAGSRRTHIAGTGIQVVHTQDIVEETRQHTGGRLLRVPLCVPVGNESRGLGHRQSIAIRAGGKQETSQGQLIEEESLRQFAVRQRIRTGRNLGSLGGDIAA